MANSGRRGGVRGNKHWTVDIYIDEQLEERHTYAEAMLHTGKPAAIRGVGTSWRHPHDAEIPQIGDELAVARALHDLATKLRATAAEEIAAATTEASHGW